MADCMLRNLRRNRTLFQDCGDFDVYAEINGPRPVKKPLRRKKRGQLRPGVMLDDGSLDSSSLEMGPDGLKSTRIFFPQYFNLNDIHNEYPNATFILNTRPFDSWIRSIQGWQQGLDWQFVNEFYQRGELEYLPNDRNNKTEMEEFMKEIYQRHHARIRKFVKDHSSHMLLELPILDNDAGQILASAFGLDSQHWEIVNSNRGTSKVFGMEGQLWINLDDSVSAAVGFVFGVVAAAGTLAAVAAYRFRIRRGNVLPAWYWARRKGEM